VPKKFRSRAILECYRRADEARPMAEAAGDLLEKTDFLEIEKTWLSLARSPELWVRRTSNSEPFLVLEVWSRDFQTYWARPQIGPRPTA